MMAEITNKTLREIAEYILYSQVEDVEHLTVWEVTADQFTFGNDEEKQTWDSLTEEEQSEIINKVDSYISRAKITIEIPED